MRKGTPAHFNEFIDRISSFSQKEARPLFKTNPSPVKLRGGVLPDLDSNQDKQSQSLSYYRYTIRQFRIKTIFPLFSAAKIT